MPHFLLTSDVGDYFFHPNVPAACEYKRCILQVKQHHIGPGCFDPPDQFTEYFLCSISYSAPHDVVGSDLPNQQIWLVTQHVPINSGDVVTQIFHYTAAID